MISPAELRRKLLKRYLQLLKDLIRGESAFPYRPRVNLEVDYSSHAKGVAELRALEEKAKPRLGYGYTLEYKTVGTRRHGTQTRPRALYFETADDLFAFIGKQKEVKKALQAVEESRSVFSLSDKWLASNLTLILRYIDRWADILRTVRQLLELDSNVDLDRLHSRSLPVTLDTKFIERHRTPIQKILEELKVDSFNLNGSIFSGEMLVWLRFHRSAHSFYNAGIGLFPAEEFARMDPPAERVLIIENKACFIQELPDYIETLLPVDSPTTTLLVWGQGNACLRLKSAEWLSRKELYYWGDMDLHGLAILGRFRRLFPETRSLAMDMAGYERYSDFAVAGEQLERGSWYDYLYKEERKLADYLLNHHEKSRIEQERIV